MKVVLAGGSGYVGRHLTARLLADGHDPIVLSRRPERAAKRLPPRTRVVGWDPTATAAGWTRALVGASAVVNLAGASLGRWPWTDRTKRSLRDSRLQSTNAIVDAIAAIPPPDRPGVLVSASGVDIYEGWDAEPATETTPAAGTFLARLCVDWELAAQAAVAFDVRVVTMRSGVVLGSRAPALARLRLPFRLLAGGPIGSGRQWVSWISLDDAVELYARAIQCWDVEGPWNVVAPEPVRQADFARVLGDVLGRPARIRTPALAVRLVLGDQATLALGSRRASPAKAQAAGFVFRHGRLEDALRVALG